MFICTNLLLLVSFDASSAWWFRSALAPGHDFGWSFPVSTTVAPAASVVGRTRCVDASRPRDSRSWKRAKNEQELKPHRNAFQVVTHGLYLCKHGLCKHCKFGQNTTIKKLWPGPGWLRHRTGRRQAAAGGGGCWDSSDTAVFLLAWRQRPPSSASGRHPSTRPATTDRLAGRLKASQAK